MARSSVAADQFSVTEFAVMSDALSGPGALGGVLSTGTVTVIVVEDPVLPAASWATVCSVWLPTAVAFQLNVYGALVSVAGVLPATSRSTAVTAVWSEAVAVTVVAP